MSIVALDRLPPDPSRRDRPQGRAPAPKPAAREGRVRLDLDKRRAKLLDLGIELFSRQTYEDMSIDDLAAEAGISKGLLYHYFRSKRDFYVETVRAASRRLQLL